jgi:hypothetical protein
MDQCSERAVSGDQPRRLGECSLARVLDPELADDVVKSSVGPWHVRSIAGETLHAGKAFAQLIDRSLRIVRAISLQFGPAGFRGGQCYPGYGPMTAGHVDKAGCGTSGERPLEKVLPEMCRGRIARTGIVLAYGLVPRAPERIPMLHARLPIR